LTIYFAKASLGVVQYCDNLTDQILFSFDHQSKIVCFEIDGASIVIPCHSLETAEIVDNLSPFTLNSNYDDEKDILTVKFINSIDSKEESTDYDNVHLLYDSNEKLVGMIFRNARGMIAKTLSDEEAAELSNRILKERKELTKWFRSKRFE